MSELWQSVRPQLFTWLLLIAKLAKSASVIKVALAAGSVGAYAMLFTWEFALVLVGALMIHEYGHVVAMRQVGIPTKGFYLIPFVGGAAVPDRAFHTRWEEMYVAYMGPVYGLGSVALLIVAYIITQEPFWAAAASTVALMNAFNLLPILPLDGGRMLRSALMSIHQGYAVYIIILFLLLGLVLSVGIGSVLLGFIVAVGALELRGDVEKEKETPQPKMDTKTIVHSGLVYLVLWAGFVGTILVKSQVPGADLAEKVMLGKEEKPVAVEEPAKKDDRPVPPRIPVPSEY